MTVMVDGCTRVTPIEYKGMKEPYVIVTGLRNPIRLLIHQKPKIKITRRDRVGLVMGLIYHILLVQQTTNIDTI